MNRKNKDLAKKELEKIYDSEFSFIKNGKSLKKKFFKSLEEHPKLAALLKLLIIANVGIWLTVGLVLLQLYRS